MCGGVTCSTFAGAGCPMKRRRSPKRFPGLNVGMTRSRTFLSFSSMAITTPTRRFRRDWQIGRRNGNVSNVDSIACGSKTRCCFTET